MSGNAVCNEVKKSGAMQSLGSSKLFKPDYRDVPLEPEDSAACLWYASVKPDSPSLSSNEDITIHIISPRTKRPRPSGICTAPSASTFNYKAKSTRLDFDSEMDTGEGEASETESHIHDFCSQPLVLSPAEISLADFVKTQDESKNSSPSATATSANNNPATVNTNECLGEFKDESNPDISIMSAATGSENKYPVTATVEEFEIKIEVKDEPKADFSSLSGATATESANPHLGKSNMEEMEFKVEVQDEPNVDFASLSGATATVSANPHPGPGISTMGAVELKVEVKAEPDLYLSNLSGGSASINNSRNAMRCETPLVENPSTLEKPSRKRYFISE